MKKVLLTIVLLFAIPNVYAATDDFNRANGLIGANWTSLFNTGLSTLAVLSNQCNPGITYDYSYWNAASFGNDQYSQFLFVGTATSDDSSGYTGLLVRAQGTTNAGSGYFLDFHSGTTSILYSIVSGTFTSIATGWVTPSTGQTVKLRVEGNLLTYSINGTDQNSVFNSDVLTGGAPGIVGFKSTSNLFIDDWAGDTIGSSAVVKTINGTAIANIKTINGTAVANVKTFNSAAYQ